MQTAFPWTRPPAAQALHDIASGITVTLSVGRDIVQTGQGHLATLAVCNIVGRLPVGLLVRAHDQASQDPLPPPYNGETLVAAVDELGTQLKRPLRIEEAGRATGLTVQIEAQSHRSRWQLATRGWTAYMGATPSSSTELYNPPAAYLLGCMLGGEVLRVWARETAASGAGHAGASFSGRTRPAADRWVNLWAPGTATQGPHVDASGLPPIDWVGAGAVNQATLAVLAAIPGRAAEGRVIDPKLLDLPDLNRSLLSFHEDVGQTKANVTATRAADSGLSHKRGSYPYDVDPMPASWIVAGTDDVRVRSEIQRLWPQRFVVTATEGVFGYVAWHAPERPDLACAGCVPSDEIEPEDRTPTSPPTSVAAGVVTAATLLRLAAGSQVPARTDILTLRLDADHALDGFDPVPTPGCATCATRLAAS
ncbi:MAG: ThiF family adenylyltransferase [Actinomycetota bacterium]|nr:ThiF family adenylyltransferase [Actinomycetota bacterium]